MTPASHIQAMEELDYRESKGIVVSLLWHRRSSNRLSVLLEDDKGWRELHAPRPPRQRRDFFTHPYACAEPLHAA